MNESEMIPVTEKLPPFDELVLVVGETHSGIALAKRREWEEWEVQPFREDWYTTFNGITHWAKIKSNLEEPKEKAGGDDYPAGA